MPPVTISRAKEIIYSQEDIPIPIKDSGYRLFLHELERPDPKTKRAISPKRALNHVLGWMKIQRQKQARESLRINPIHKRLLYLLIVEGYTQGQAALEMKRSRESIKKYCIDIRKQLGAETFYQVVAIAVARGVVPPPPQGR